jgi:hypothetical protein
LEWSPGSCDYSSSFLFLHEDVLDRTVEHKG